MSESSESPEPQKKKLDVAPRTLPDRHEDLGDPFEQLNESRAEESAAEEGSRSMIQPRDLPEKDEATILQAARLLKAGKSHDEVAAQLKIEPLKLRRWEAAYSATFQQDLNEGDYHDTDAQLRSLDEEAKEKFQGNWEQVTEKATERRVKTGPVRAKLMANPFTRWMFRSETGALDLGALTGIVVALVGVGVAVSYMNRSRDAQVEEEDLGILVSLDDVGKVVHNPQAAAKAVIAFHRTEKWEDKLDLVTHPEIVRPLMKAWYEKYPDKVHYDRITFVTDQPVEEQGRYFVLLGMLVGDDDNLPMDDEHSFVAVQLMEDGNYKVDWETSSGYQPYSFVELTEQRPTEPFELRLTVEASDFYNFGFDEETYFSFRGTFLGQDAGLYLYGRRDQPDVRQLSNTLKVRENSGVIAKVRYPVNAASENQVELLEVISQSWFRRYDGS